MGTGEQLVTIAAVLLGALTTHLTNHLMERSRTKYQLLTRWDEKKLDTYGDYVDKIRTCILLSSDLHAAKQGLREVARTESEILAELVEAMRVRGLASERIMLLAGDDVVEAAHELNAVTLEVDRHATGQIEGDSELWRERNRAAFRALNAFHEAARKDLGVQGRVTGAGHPTRDLLLPAPRRAGDDSARQD